MSCMDSSTAGMMIDYRVSDRPRGSFLWQDELKEHSPPPEGSLPHVSINLISCGKKCHATYCSVSRPKRAHSAAKPLTEVSSSSWHAEQI